MVTRLPGYHTVSHVEKNNNTHTYFFYFLYILILLGNRGNPVTYWNGLSSNGIFCCTNPLFSCISSIFIQKHRLLFPPILHTFVNRSPDVSRILFFCAQDRKDFLENHPSRQSCSKAVGRNKTQSLRTTPHFSHFVSSSKR